MNVHPQKYPKEVASNKDQTRKQDKRCVMLNTFARNGWYLSLAKQLQCLTFSGNIVIVVSSLTSTTVKSLLDICIYTSEQIYDKVFCTNG